MLLSLELEPRGRGGGRGVRVVVLLWRHRAALEQVVSLSHTRQVATWIMLGLMLDLVADMQHQRTVRSSGEGVC